MSPDFIKQKYEKIEFQKVAFLPPYCIYRSTLKNIHIHFVSKYHKLGEWEYFGEKTFPTNFLTYFIEELNNQQLRNGV